MSKIGSDTLVFVVKYHNMHALLNAWEFGDGEAVPRDYEDLHLFLIKHNLLDQFEIIVTALKISLTLPVSSAHDEIAFSCLKRVKTILYNIVKRLSDLHVFQLAGKLLSISILAVCKPRNHGITKRNSETTYFFPKHTFEI